MKETSTAFKRQILMRSDYMQPGFIFSQPCRWCGNCIRFTRETGPPKDLLSSDKCRQGMGYAELAMHRNNMARKHCAPTALQPQRDGGEEKTPW